MSELIDIGGIKVPATFDVDCHWVVENLAFGGMIGTERNMHRLRETGFTHVLGLQAEFDDRTIVGDSGIDVRYLPVENYPKAPPTAALANAMDLGVEILSDPEARLFVHCLAGRNRAPTFSFAILRAIGHDAETAEELILAAQPSAQLDRPDLGRIDGLAKDRAR